MSLKLPKFSFTALDKLMRKFNWKNFKNSNNNKTKHLEIIGIMGNMNEGALHAQIFCYIIK